MKYMKIFIGCSSSSDIPNKYQEDCQKLLKEIFTRDYDLVYGAYNQGLMNYCYQFARNNNHQVIGITPEIFKEDLSNLNCTKEIITENILRRTEKLINESDILLFLPGGIGTIHELLTAIESKRSNEFKKPILIYNSNNFFDKLLSFFEKQYQENFTKKSVKTVYKVFNDYNSLINYLDKINEKERITPNDLND